MDAWQSPNGFDILGMVIYQLAAKEAWDSAKGWIFCFIFIFLDPLPLIAPKADLSALIQICGSVSNITSNNKAMVKELKKQNWAQFKGEAQWVRCFSHVLKLIVQSILCPFETWEGERINQFNNH